MERIGDHAEALINLTDYLIRKKVVFSEAALAELEDIYNQTHQFVGMLWKLSSTMMWVLQNQLVARHEAIEKLEKKTSENSYSSFEPRWMYATSRVNFIDIISHYTRVADHAMNLAEKYKSSKFKERQTE